MRLRVWLALGVGCFAIYLVIGLDALRQCSERDNVLSCMLVKAP